MAKKKKRAKSKKAFRLKLKKGTANSVAQIVFFSLAGLAVISFARQGLILVRINDLMVNYLSWTSIFLPFLFLVSGFLISKFRNPLAQPNVLVGTLLFMIAITTLARAGILGSAAWEGMSMMITAPGAAIVLLGAMIAGLIVLFNTSLHQVVSYTLGLTQSGKRYVFGDQQFTSDLKRGKFDKKFAKGEFTVKGGDDDTRQPKPKNDPSKPQTSPSAQKPKSPESDFEDMLVSNVESDKKVWKYPPDDLLSNENVGKADRGDIKGNAGIIEQTLESFGITARVVEVNLGPTVTQYAIEVALGTKLSKITNLDRDLALALAAPTGTIRIEAPIPGRSLVGIELPNVSPEFVTLKKMLGSETMENAKSKLSISLGLDVSGKPIVADLAKMPHVLIAGQTGSGKSICINTILGTVLFRAAPSEVKFILVDPKRVELTGYNGIPHLLSPVIVEPEKVISALRWLMREMDNRYKHFAKVGARNIESFNEMSGFQALPYIVLIIDELADIMLFAPTEVEDAITRLAQMSRAVGIHMVLSTQRPSVNVITGLIKANIPSRISFAVASQVDSRVILDGQGAEKLLGRGDMLYLSPEKAKPTRIQGAFISDKEINGLVDFLKNQGVEPQYTEEVTSMAKPGTTTVAGIEEDLDELYEDAVRIVCQYDRASASLLQRRLSVGYARAARILDQLEASGVVSTADGSKPRDVLIQDPDNFLANRQSATAATPAANDAVSA